MMKEGTVWVGTRNSLALCSPPLSPSAPGNQAPRVRGCGDGLNCIYPATFWVGLEEGRGCRGPGEMGCEVVSS